MKCILHMRQMKSVSTSLEKDEVERVKRLAKHGRTSAATIIRNCVAAYLPELERGVGLLGVPCVAKNGKRKH